MGEKTGWTYITVSENLAHQLKADDKRSFRVKGRIDDLRIEMVALLPMGNGDFILPVNSDMRKELRKGKGDQVRIQLEYDENDWTLPPAFDECLKDEPEALIFFQSLPKSHQRYFIKWIESAKTEITRATRIAHSVNALYKKQGYNIMIQNLKKARL